MIASTIFKASEHTRSSGIALLLAAALLFPALLQAADPAVTDETAAAGEAVAEAVEPAAEAAVAAEPPQFGPGMQIPVDGSSLEAFDQSLEKIKAAASEDEYTTLQNAINWHLTYDLAARRNREKLAKNLDGLTGEEIVEKVRWR